MNIKVKILAMIGAVAIVAGCSNRSEQSPLNHHWEYKTIEIENSAHLWADEAYRKMETNAPDWEKLSRLAKNTDGDFSFDGDSNKYTADLRSLGDAGWELVSAVPLIETLPEAEQENGQAFDSAADKLVPHIAKYANVRTGKLILIFKREQ